jgi:hypothetical protein
MTRLIGLRRGLWGLEMGVFVGNGLIGGRVGENGVLIGVLGAILLLGVLGYISSPIVRLIGLA